MASTVLLSSLLCPPNLNLAPRQRCLLQQSLTSLPGPTTSPHRLLQPPRSPRQGGATPLPAAVGATAAPGTGMASPRFTVTPHLDSSPRPVRDTKADLHPARLPSRRRHSLLSSTRPCPSRLSSKLQAHAGQLLLYRPPHLRRRAHRTLLFRHTCRIALRPPVGRPRRVCPKHLPPTQT